ncbi:alpha/beta hydrolase [bacterium]|nr:alpha/beta hydrolase [bacterium]
MGHVHIIRDFFSIPEGYNRTIRIYTPNAYDAEPDRRFPVLYFQDGQNAFAHPESAVYHTWCANDVIERLAAEGATEPWIIVAIDHGVQRFEEYSPWDDYAVGVQGRGSYYTDFLVNHLVPYIDATYRTRPEPQWRGTIGASLGGLISLFVGWRHPDVFGRVGGVSPSLMWCQGWMFSSWKEHSRKWTRIYLDAGENERVDWAGVDLDYGNTVRNFHDHLRSIGYAAHEVHMVIEPHGNHHEIDWQRRLPEALRWLLG